MPRPVIVALLVAVPLWSCEAKQPDAPRVPEPKVAALEQPPPAPAPVVNTAEPPATGGSALPEFTALVEQVKASVFNVEVTQSALRGGGNPHSFSLPGVPEDFWKDFFGQRPPGQGGDPSGPMPPNHPPIRGVGSGFIISGDGLALTNNHVIENAANIQVTLEDGRKFDAEVLGKDALTDLALLKLKGKVADLPVAKLGDSDALKVGEWVVAIGNPFGLASSVSAGILSAKERVIGAGPYDDFLQTDAAINPGNSGGPLFNLRGEVVGINTAIVGEGAGIGFAVPVNLAKALLPQLKREGFVTRGFLGVGVQDLGPELAKAMGVPVEKGAVIGEVSEGSPADKGGLKTDDVVTELDGEEVISAQALTRKVAFKAPGSKARLKIYRDGKEKTVQLTLGTRPDLEGVGGGGRSRPEAAEDDARKLGLVIRDVPKQLTDREEVPEGAYIEAVEPASPADRAGLMPGMIVTQVNRKDIASARELMAAVKRARSGDVLLLRIFTGQGKLLRPLPIP